MENNQTLTYTVDTAANTERQITVTVDYNFDFVDFLDKEFEGVDKSFTLLDVRVS